MARPDSELGKWLDRFVCVRMVKMRGVDLGQFQFDYDLQWAALLLHADGTVLARYGSGSPDGAMARNSMAGFRATMERVLSIHADYENQRSRFTGKNGPKPAYARAELIPSPKIRRLLAGNARQSCIHCHNVYDGLHDLIDDRPDYDPKAIHKYPPPEALGLTIEVDDGTRVERVAPGSAAATAGIEAGDVVLEVDEQPILSIADIQFALHVLAEDANSVTLNVRRDDTVRAFALPLAEGWRASDISWRGSMWNLPPGPGIWTAESGPRVRATHGVTDPSRVALTVRGVFSEPGRRSGLRKGDLIIAVDGKTDHLTGPGLAAHIRLHHYKMGSQLKLRVVRGGKPQELTVVFD